MSDYQSPASDPDREPTGMTPPVEGGSGWSHPNDSMGYGYRPYGGEPPYGGWAQPPQGYWPPRYPRRRGRLVALGIASLAIATLVGIGIGHSVWHSSQNPATQFGNNSSPSVPFQQPSGSSGSNAAANTGVAAKVDPGLVDINTTLGYQSEQAAGTGIVLTSSGEVLTNNHVINGATSIQVTDIGNGRTYSASVVGYDRSDDIAVLKLQNASGLRTATLGNAKTAAVGTPIVAIGNAGGVGGTPSAASGVITALGQSVTASDQSDNSSENLAGLIQVNADVEAGDSGGPLVTESGSVIGVDTAASSGFQFQSAGQSGGTTGHEGFAIPINHATAIAKQIVDDQGSSTVHIGKTGFLGIEVEAASGRDNNQLGAGGYGGSTSGTGVAIVGVLENSPVAQTGMSAGDTIVSVGGHAVNSPNDLSNVLGRYHPGDTVKVVWQDNMGQRHTTSVGLASGPAA